MKITFGNEDGRMGKKIQSITYEKKRDGTIKKTVTKKGLVSKLAPEESRIKKEETSSGIRYRETPWKSAVVDDQTFSEEERARLPKGSDSRISNFFTGVAKQSAGTVAEVPGFAAEGFGRFAQTFTNDAVQLQTFQKRLDRDQQLLKAAATPQERAKLSHQINQWRTAIGNLQSTKPKATDLAQQELVERGRKMRDAAQKITASGVADSEKAKEGLGKFGRFVVDAATAGTQMAIDAAVGLALSPITGGTSLLGPMAVRSFGGAAQEARETGASLPQQLAYGAGSAALAVGTEKMFNNNFFDQKFGGSVLDKTVDAGLERIGLGAAAKSAPGRIAKSALEEGLEEVVEARFQTPLRQATVDPDAVFDPKDAAYQGAIGAVLGGLGGAANVALKPSVRQSEIPPALQNFNAVQDPVQTAEESAPPALEDAAPRQAEPLEQPAKVEPIVQAIQTVAQQQSAARQASVQAIVDAARQTPVQPNTETSPQNVPLLLPAHLEEPSAAAERPQFMGPPALDLRSGRTGPADPALKAILDGSKRAGIDSLSKQEQDALFLLSDTGLVDMDADKRVFRVDPEQHIDQRGSADVSSRKVHAFQYDHPQLHEFYRQAAEVLFDDLQNTQRGGEISPYASDKHYTGTGYARLKRMTSAPIAELLDGGMSYARIEKALDAIIHDQGQENYADAKRVELVLDNILSNGYKSFTRGDVSPSYAYLTAKAEIGGSLEETPLPDLRSAAQSESPFGIPKESRFETEQGRETPENQEAQETLATDDFADYDFELDLQLQNGTDGLGAADAGSVDSDFVRMQNQTGQFQHINPIAAQRTAQEHFRAPDEVPVKNPATGLNISKTVSTILNSPITSNEMAPILEAAIAQGQFDYTPITDQSSLDVANARIAELGGYREAAAQVLAKSDAGMRLDKDDITTLQVTLQKAGQAADAVTFFRTATALTLNGRTAAQVMQAMKIINRLSPEGKLLSLQQALSSMNARNGVSAKTADYQIEQEYGVPYRVHTGESAETSQSAETAESADTQTDPGTKAILDLHSQQRQQEQQAVQTDPGTQAILDIQQQSQLELPGEGETHTPSLAQKRLSFLDRAKEFLGIKKRPIQINQQLAEDYLRAATQEERDAAWDALLNDVASQVPNTLGDMWNAWRYLAMLANPTTHIRNTVGNVIFGELVRRVKNLAGAGAEHIFVSDQTQRTKTGLFTFDRKLVKFARSQYEADRALAMGKGKYADSSEALREIQERRKILPGILDTGSKFNSAALDAEDLFFNRSAYVDSLAQALRAKGVTAEEAMNGEKADLVESARAYAIKEAQKATFRDANAFSDLIAGLGRAKDNSLGQKIKAAAVDSQIPFRRTPANILVRGLEYGPAGFLKAISYDFIQFLRGKMSGAELADHLASGVTGTVGAFALGAFLAAQGLLTMRAGGDQDEKNFLSDAGFQDFALNIGGHSYTLGWMAPLAMPLFAGAALEEAFEDNGFSFKTLLSALDSTAHALSVSTEALLETSMFSSLKQLLEGIGYAGNKAWYVIAQTVLSYISQGVPTLSGKIASVADGTVRKSFVPGGTPEYREDLSYAFQNSLQKKIPLARNQMQPKIDLWGQEVSNGELPERLFQAFLSPGSLRTIRDDDLTKELMRLSESLGSSSVYPKTVEKSFKINGEEEKVLTAEEYTQFAKIVGQTRRQVLDKLLVSPGYQRLSDDGKADAIAQAYEYAKAVGKMSVSSWRPDKNDRIGKMLRNILPPASYILYSINADRDGSGSTNYTESALTLAEDPNLTNDQRGQAWGMFNSSTKEEKNPFIGALSSVGVDTETAINILEAYRDLSNQNAHTDLKPKERNATFWSYVNTLGLNSDQRDTVSNVFKFYGSYLVD